MTPDNDTCPHVDVLKLSPADRQRLALSDTEKLSEATVRMSETAELALQNTGYLTVLWLVEKLWDDTLEHRYIARAAAHVVAQTQLILTEADRVRLHLPPASERARVLADCAGALRHADDVAIKWLYDHLHVLWEEVMQHEDYDLRQLTVLSAAVMLVSCARLAPSLDEALRELRDSTSPCG